MAGQASRKYSADVSVLSVGGTDILAMFKSVTLRITAETMESRAVKDFWKFPVGRISSWQIDISKTVEDESGLTSMIGLYGAVVTVNFTTSAAKGIIFSGSALVNEFTGNFPDEAQEHGITLMGRGQPTVTYTP